MWDNALRLAIWKYVWEFSYFNLTPNLTQNLNVRKNNSCKNRMHIDGVPLYRRKNTF